MLLALTLACLLATAAAGPVHYDQRQQGEVNAQVDISNLLFVFAIPKKIPTSLFDIFSKSDKPLDPEHDIQERANVRVIEAFVEPNTPYHVEIGSERSEEGAGRTAEVVIAGRRRLEIEPQEDDLKLLGATENCGPNRTRDAMTLMCKDVQLVENNADAELTQTGPKTPTEGAVESQPIPEVVSS